MKFKSSFASKLKDYLSHMARVGRKPSYLFYARFFDNYWFHHAYPPSLTKERLTAWIKQIDGESISRQHFRITLTRQFGRYLQSEGMYEQYVLPERICARIPRYVPHFFDDYELAKFFAECRKLQPVSIAMHRQIVLPQLFSLI
jgi:hypothetical protein